MGSNEYQNIAKEKDYQFYDPFGYGQGYGQQSQEAMKAGQQGMNAAQGGFNSWMNQAQNLMDPNVNLQGFGQTAQNIRQTVWDSPYASQMMGLNQRFVDEAAQRTAGQYAGMGSLYSGAAARAVGQSAQDESAKARMQAMGYYGNLETGLLGQAMGMYGQRPGLALQGAGLQGQNLGQYMNLYGQGLQNYGQAAGMASGVVAPQYVKQNNWFDNLTQGAGALGAAAGGIGSLFMPGGVATGVSSGLSNLFGGGQQQQYPQYYGGQFGA